MPVLAGLAIALAGSLAPQAVASTGSARPATDPAQATCVVEGPDILEATAQPCGTLAADAPGLPTAVRTRVTGPDSITVRWQAPTGKKARTYSVYAFTGTEGTLVCKVNRLRCTASNLEVDKEYVFYVVPTGRCQPGRIPLSDAIARPR